MNETTVDLAIRSALAVVVVAAVVTLAWANKITGGEAIAAISALVGGVLHATGVATGRAAERATTTKEPAP